MKQYQINTKCIIVVENPDGCAAVGSTIIRDNCSIIDQLFCPMCNPSCKSKHIIYNQHNCYNCGTTLKPRFPTYNLSPTVNEV